MADRPESRQSGDDVPSSPEHGADPMPASALDEDLLEAGTEVGEYVVDKAIGEGSFGNVYSAQHPLIGKRAAIKVLHRKFSSDPRVVQRFVREAQAVNRIQHRNIIDVFSFGELADGRRYLIMELLHGETLQDMLNSLGALTIQEAYPILKGVAEALDAAHAEGVAHRDLKPENIFVAVDRDGLVMPKLLDFGIAKLIDDEERGMHKTATGQAVGTPLYMAPEQCRGKPVDHRTDLYAFGVVIYQVLSGHVPFTGESAVDVLYKHISEVPPNLSDMGYDIPVTLDRPVLHLMEKQPKRRPATAMKALEAIMAAAAEGGLDVSEDNIAARSVEEMRQSRNAPSSLLAERRSAELDQALRLNASSGAEKVKSKPKVATADTVVGAAIEGEPVAETGASETLRSGVDELLGSGDDTIPAPSTSDGSLSLEPGVTAASASATLDAVSSGRRAPSNPPMNSQRKAVVGGLALLGVAAAAMYGLTASETPSPDRSRPVAPASKTATPSTTHRPGPPVTSAPDDDAAPTATVTSTEAAPATSESPPTSAHPNPRSLPAAPRPRLKTPPAPPPPPTPVPSPKAPDFLDDR